MSRPKHITESRFEFLSRSVLEHLKSANRNACLIWPFGTIDGYGTLAWSPDPSQPRLKAIERCHRLAYFLLWEEWPLPLGRHLCPGGGDSLCYNPLHITQGTDAENYRDKVRDGRLVVFKGEQNGSSKLTAELVLQLRRDSATMPQIELVRKYGIDRRSVRRILIGTAWNHVPIPPETRQKYKDAFGVNDGSKKLTEQDIRDIRSQFSRGTLIKELVVQYKVSRITIGRIVRRVRWAHIS